MSQAILGGVVAAAIAGSVLLERAGVTQASPRKTIGASVDINPEPVPLELMAVAEDVMLGAEPFLDSEEAKDAYWDFLVGLLEAGDSAGLEEQRQMIVSKKAPAPDTEVLHPIEIDDQWGNLTEVPANLDLSGAGDSSTVAEIEGEFARLQKPVAVIRCYEGWAFDRFVVEPVGKHSRTSLCLHSEDIQARLGLGKPPLVSTTPQGVGVDIPRTDRRWPRLGDYLDTVPDSPGFWIPFGVSVEGSAQWVNLSDPNSSHCLIAGTSGSGKSVLEMGILESIEALYPGKAEVYAIDPKGGVEAANWKQSVVKGTASTPEHAVAILRAINERRKRICSKMVERGWRDWSENPNGKRVIYLCDEFAQLSCPPTTGDKAADTAAQRLSGEFNSLVDEIARLGRSAGIHLILCTQSPRREVITPSIRDNLPIRCCLLVATKEISGVILSESGPPRGQNLLGKGDMILKVAGSIDARVQAFNPFSEVVQ